MTPVPKASLRTFQGCLVAAVILTIASYTVYKTRTGDWTQTWQRAAVVDFSHELGAAYQARTGRLELSSHERPSPAQVLENGRMLGPSNAPHADIREQGGGRFSFWHDYVYFSASDNSDPRTNGRSYAIWYPPVTRTQAWTLYLMTMAMLIAFGLATAWLAWSLRSAGYESMSIIRVAFAVSGPSIVTRMTAIRFRRWTPAKIAASWVMAGILIAACETTYLTRTAQWTWLWRAAPLSEFAPETGFAFIAHTGRPDLGSHDVPEPTALYENGVQLGLRNAQHAEIREVGRGRYSFWHDYVLFATSDNSDPRTNGRTYTMVFPPLSRAAARILYATTAAVMLFALIISLPVLPSAAVRASTAVGRLGQRYAIAVLAGLIGATLLWIPLLRASPTWAPIATDAWVPVLVLNAGLAIAIRARWGRALPRALLAGTLIALAAGYFILTVRAPHRTQGCHTSEPTPVWRMYCVAPDSASYYTGYTVGSTRQPLYPWFIAAVTAGTGFEPRQYLQTVGAGEPRYGDEPLFRVVHAQQLLLLAASLVACAAFMVLLGSTLPAAVFLFLYDMQFFSAGELNFVLTEPLVQTVQFLLVAAFAAFLARRRPVFIVAAGAASGLAYLTRQASAYSALLFFLVVGMALVAEYRRLRLWCVAAVAVFALTALLPDLYALAATGSAGKQQDSLQYQYRIAHAMQYATPEDLALMPDDRSRDWLRDAMVRRDAAHRALEAKFAGDEYNTLVYYVNDNLYVAAIPPGDPGKTPQFYMSVATPILIKHWSEYLRFAFRFWVVALERPQVSRLGLFGLSPWWTYGGLFAIAWFVGGWRGLAGVTLVLCHWAAVALACLFAAPIPRMVWASEFLVVLSGLLLIWSAGERVAAIVARRATARVPRLDAASHR